MRNYSYYIYTVKDYWIQVRLEHNGINETNGFSDPNEFLLSERSGYLCRQQVGCFAVDEYIGFIIELHIEELYHVEV